MSDKPVAYKRSVTRRESFRIDFDPDEVRAALSNALDEDIPDSAAFRLHDDCGATFCWDVDVDMNEHTEDSDERGCEDPACYREHYEILVHVTEDDDGGVHVDPNDEGPTVEPRLAAEIFGDKPPAQTVRVEAASLEFNENPVVTTGKRCTNLVRAGATKLVRCDLDAKHVGACELVPEIPVKLNEPEALTPYEKNMARHADDMEQCGGTFFEGATRSFRCHLDVGHDEPCGAAEGCEPEDPPKGRRRSW